jgi:hypothetical protein
MDCKEVIEKESLIYGTQKGIFNWGGSIGCNCSLKIPSRSF